MIYFECPECREELSVPACLAGEAQQCPVCAAQVLAPSPEPAPADGEIDMAAVAEDLQHPNPDVRVKAVKTLAAHGGNSDETVQMLVHKFRDRDRDVRDAVAMALLDIGQPQIVGMVVRELGAHWSADVLCREAVFDLVKFGPGAADSLLDILDETNHYPRRYEPEAVRAAVMLLGELGQVGSIPLLAKMFRRHFDLHVRDQAACSLAMIGKPEDWQAIESVPAGERRMAARRLAKRVMAERNVVA